MAFLWRDKLRTKFNDYCHHLVSHAPTFVMYSLSVVLTIICIDWLEKIRFISAAENELHQNTISQEVFDGVKAVVNGVNVFDSLLPIIVVGLCFLAFLFLLRRAAGINWSRVITLPVAVEFSSAMRKIGKLDFAEQMACISEHSIPVYIANDPILEDHGESISAKLYPHVRNDFLVLEDVLTKNIGKRQLCLSAADYEPIYQQYCQTAQSVTLAKIAALELDIAVLKGTLSLKEDDLVKLQEEKDDLKKQLTKVEKTAKTAPARKSKTQTADQRNIPLWRLLIPLGDRLKTEAQPEIPYTSPEIRDAFISELEKRPDLREAVQKVLRGTTQAPDDDEAKPEDAKVEGIQAEDVPDWVVNIIREDLQELVQRKPGAPNKTKKSQRSVK